MKIKRKGYHRDRGETVLVDEQDSRNNWKVKSNEDGTVRIIISRACGDGQSYYTYTIEFGAAEFRKVVSEVVEQLHPDELTARMVKPLLQAALERPVAKASA